MPCPLSNPDPLPQMLQPWTLWSVTSSHSALPHFSLLWAPDTLCSLTLSGPTWGRLPRRQEPQLPPGTRHQHISKASSLTAAICKLVLLFFIIFFNYLFFFLVLLFLNYYPRDSPFLILKTCFPPPVPQHIRLFLRNKSEADEEARRAKRLGSKPLSRSPFSYECQIF